MSHSSQTIMIVEDERIVAEDMRQVLEIAGYNVCGIAKNSDEALACAREHHPNLALMDIVIRGDHDGIETAKMLRAEMDISFIYLTAYSQEGVVERAKQTDPLAYIVKPFEESTLLSTIDIALHKAKLDGQLRKSHELFFTTLKSIGDGVISTDVEGQIVFMNGVAENLTGWYQDEASGRNIREVFHIVNEATRQAVDIPSLVAMSNNRVVPLANNTLLISRDGREFPIDDAGSPIHDPDGSIVGSVLIFRDVAEKQQKQREIQSYQEKLEALLSARTEEVKRRAKIEQSVTSLTTDLIRMDLSLLEQGMVSVLQNAEKALGLKFAAFTTQYRNCNLAKSWIGESSCPGCIPEEVLTSYLRRLDDDSPETGITTIEDWSQSAIPDDLRKGLEACGVESLTVVTIRDTASRAQQDESNAYLTLGAGRTGLNIEDLRMIKMLAEVMQSVIARKHSEEEREELRAELLQSQKMEAIGKLSGGIAHDFNNLLLPILGHCELMLEDDSDPESPIRAIQKAAGNAAALTRQLLAFSRKQVLRKEPVVLATIVAEMRDILSRIIGEDIQVSTEIEQGISPALADPGQLGQILLNLAVNARDAMQGGGTLHICARAADPFEVPSGVTTPFVAVDVIDTGCGIAPSKLGCIFEPFYSSKGSEGTGLGLSVVKGIVEQHGGVVRVTSEVNRGTTFTVVLPAAGPIDQNASRQSCSRLGANSSQETGRILLVEDEPSVMQFVEKVLSRKGYLVESATNVKEACRLYDTRTPGEWSLVFTDAMLPDGTGMDVINHVGARCRGASILLSSGYSDNRALVQLAEERRLHFLPKPYTVSTLYDAVSEAMAVEATALSA
ncbi:MAG: response regulator [Verrucomicrobiae bacterium]|nr:response regulator [Verrucomicrobiae bacterium]